MSLKAAVAEDECDTAWRGDRFALWALIPIGLLALLLRCWQINESLWLDELHTAWVVAGSIGEIPARAGIGNHSPVYFWLVWITTTICGASELSLRLPSLIAGMTLIPVAFLLVRKWSGSVRAALCVALLVAWDRNFVFYSQEARAYALVQLVAVAQVYAFWHLQQICSRRGRVVFVAASVLLIYLHYTAALLLAGELVWFAVVLATRRSQATYRLRQLVVDLVWVSAALLPAIPHLRSIAARRANWELFIGHLSWAEIAHWFSLGAYLVVPLVGIIVVRIAGRRRSTQAAGGVDTLTVCLVGCWLGVPLVVAWLVTSTDLARLFFPRYLVASALAAIVFAGLCLAASPRGAAQNGLIAIVLLVSLFHSGALQRFSRDGQFLRKQGWRSAVRLINSIESGSGRPVLVRSGFLEADQLHRDPSDLLRRFCLAPITSLYRIDVDDRELIPLPTTGTAQLDSAALQSIRDRSGAWFVINGSAESLEGIERALKARLQQQNVAIRQELRKSFGSVLVLLLTVPSDSEDLAN